MRKLPENEKEKDLKLYRKRSQKALKRRIKRKRQQKNLRRSWQRKSKEQVKDSKKYKGFTDIKAPDNFQFIENTDKTIEFIDKLEKMHASRRKVKVILNNVKQIDYAAITVLLSVMHFFKSRGIPFDGTFPDDLEVKAKLMQSHFFEKLSQSQRTGTEYTLKKENQIFTKSNLKVDPELGLKVMEEVSETIWGEKRRTKGGQRTLLELMQNTHNHASVEGEGEEHWWFSVNHLKEEKKVTFVFVDYGQGILHSLQNKPDASQWSNILIKAKQAFKFGSNADILKLLLMGELHKIAITKKPYRGKGLPGIRQALERNQIDNLHIISNDAYSDVKNSEYRTLSRNFNGTFIYWELCYNNVNEQWII